MCDVWQLTYLVKPTISIQLSEPDNLFDDMRYLGCSYGHLIFSDSEHCLLVDAYTGVPLVEIIHVPVAGWKRLLVAEPP